MFITFKHAISNTTMVVIGNVDGRTVHVASHHRERVLRRLDVLVILRGRHIAHTEIVDLIGRFRIDQPDADELFGMRK
jgi:hypothetical protein